MSWWNRLWRGGAAQPSPPRFEVRLALPGWREDAPDGEMRMWHDSQGDVLSLAIPASPFGSLELSDEAAVQDWCRNLAESREAGLIEVKVIKGRLGSTVSHIYKRLQMSAQVFTGMFLVPGPENYQVWTVVAGERGITGMREAFVTSELLTAGELTLEDYERSWAQDPYQPSYHGVDRSVLRFVSDDERYDEHFPEHPLSKVRRVLAALPSSIQIEYRNS